MKIKLAEHFGICFGVRDAIAQAEKLAAIGSLTILGELVHNPVVRERFHAQGVSETTLDQAPSKSERVMITAHGVSDLNRARLRETGATVADGTCPLVRSAHDHLKRLVASGYFPVVVGQHGHVEVNGLIGDFPEAVVVMAPVDIDRLPGCRRYGIISQTTQPIEFVRRMVALIRLARPKSEVRFVDTVCKPTKDRQSALRKLIAEADAIVVVGGHTSNNTRQLVETCLAAGKPAFHIERPEALRPHWFRKDDVVGLTAGTSTLPETVQAVHERLEQISSMQNY